jgi:RNA polymerase sigma-70 factor (ECF subfamily)
MAGARATPATAGGPGIMSDQETAGTSEESLLLRRVAMQDHEAFAGLYDRMAGVLFSNAIHMLGDRREAEEVVQDVFLQIWHKAGAFDSQLGSPLSWMLAILRNRCIDRLRSRQRRSRVFDEATEHTEVEVAASDAMPANPFSPEEVAAIHKAVAGLPEDQRQAIAMAFFGAMTHQEIADAMKEPLGTVKARIRRGMLKLRDSLQAYL